MLTGFSHLSCVLVCSHLLHLLFLLKFTVVGSALDVIAQILFLISWVRMVTVWACSTTLELESWFLERVVHLYQMVCKAIKSN